MNITATLSIAVLVVALVWSVYAMMETKKRDLNVVVNSQQTEHPDTTTPVSEAIDSSGFGLIDKRADVDDVSSIGPSVVGQLAANYFALQSQGIYTPELGKQIATEMAPHVKANVPFRTYSTSDITFDSDTSSARINHYQKDMRVALAMLGKNKRLELEIYAMYVDTQDTAYLDQLRVAATNYRLAAERASLISVPKDVVTEHVAMLNSLQEFAAVLDAMAENAQDPITSAALLRSYNNAENNIFSTFDSLITYVQTNS